MKEDRKRKGATREEGEQPPPNRRSRALYIGTLNKTDHTPNQHLHFVFFTHTHTTNVVIAEI